MKRFLTGVKVTKSQGFGGMAFAERGLARIGCYWKRKYKNRNLDEPWYILTNLGSLKETLSAYQARSGVEAMFKDCKSDAARYAWVSPMSDCIKTWRL